MMRIGLLNMIFSLAPLLIEEILKIVGGKGDDVGRIFLDYGF
jgi:hypothetical protein